MPAELQRFVSVRPARALVLRVIVGTAAAAAASPIQSGAFSQNASALAPPVITVPRGAEPVEQRAHGLRDPAALVESFDGLGVGFEGPQGTAALRNPSDNTLAVGPDHIVQIVNSRTAIFTRKGRRFATTGKVLYGPVNTNNVFKGFGGSCEARQSGDAVVRYDQVDDRWLIVMPLFSRGAPRPDQPGDWK